ncbi:MAG: hypothetical protein ACPGWR_12485 [Ardenticatenaceae bacterium]
MRVLPKMNKLTMRVLPKMNKLTMRVLPKMNKQGEGELWVKVRV